MTEPLSLLAQRALERLRGVPELEAALADATLAERVARLAIASDFAIDTVRRQPALLAALAHDAATPIAPPALLAGQAAEWPRQLRRYRAAESTRLVWRDVVEDAPVEERLAASTALAEACLQRGVAALEDDFAQRHGVVRASDGQVQRLVVFGLGKLGGGELNFSSDVDLVYAYPRGGQSDGARPLAAEDYFARLGQRLAGLLDAVTADGFCHRVDLRLRPFGQAGRVVLSFAAMDQYFQREGRDWERYAWLKARAVAGDIAAGEAWLATLRPFVYRRYLDFTALDGLRTMKAAIAADVERRERAHDIKRGAGGIREIEFLVQALQLIHGGREPALRVRPLLQALHALQLLRLVQPEQAAMLAANYRFLRQLENRLQMLRDAQVHAVPESAPERERLAAGLGYPHWPALHGALQACRAQVEAEFAQLLAPRERDAAPSALDAYWRGLPAAGDAAALGQAGFADAAATHLALCRFVQSHGVQALSDAARARLDRVVPELLQAAARSAQPDAAARRLLTLLQAILRRASYLALLDEQPSALARLVDVVARSAWMAERLAQYPLLLDELLDVRAAGPLPTREAMRRACQAALAEPDAEAALRQLNEARLALGFRIALAALDHRQPATDSARQLAWLAEEVVQAVLAMAEEDIVAMHGRIEGGRFAIVGYGSLGAEELGFGSDLDLVFLYDAPHASASTAARPLEASRWYARLAQKVMALLGAMTAAGRLYDIDVRLRPDGAKGALVSSLASYRQYQRQRAWTWEHQALVRARGIAGDATLLADFEQVRAQTLTQPVDEARLRQDVVHMRRRMRAELDRGSATRFDLKQGEGGLVDLEFVLQYRVLGEAATHRPLLALRNTAALIQALVEAGRLPNGAALSRAHDVLLGAGLACTLDRRPRLAEETADIATARGEVLAAAAACGLDFHFDLAQGQRRGGGLPP